MNRQCLYRAENSLSGRLLSGWLEQHGIEVELRGESLSGAVGELPPELLQVELWVSDAQFEGARKILQEWVEQQSKASGGSWSCPKCKEVNPVQFEICWHCGDERTSQRSNH